MSALAAFCSGHLKVGLVGNGSGGPPRSFSFCEGIYNRPADPTLTRVTRAHTHTHTQCHIQCPERTKRRWAVAGVVRKLHLAKTSWTETRPMALNADVIASEVFFFFLCAVVHCFQMVSSSFKFPDFLCPHAAKSSTYFI